MGCKTYCTRLMLCLKNCKIKSLISFCGFQFDVSCTGTYHLCSRQPSSTANKLAFFLQSSYKYSLEYIIFLQTFSFWNLSSIASFKITNVTECEIVWWLVNWMVKKISKPEKPLIAKLIFFIYRDRFFCKGSVSVISYINGQFVARSKIC